MNAQPSETKPDNPRMTELARIGIIARKLLQYFPPLIVALGFLASVVFVAYAQQKPRMEFEEDAAVFSVAQDGQIVCAVPRMKRIKKINIERDDIWVVGLNGGRRRIVEGEKFMPVPPPVQYIVESLAWSPSGRRIAMNMNVTTISSEDTTDVTGGKQLALLEAEGGEIKPSGQKERFVSDAFNAAWLADDTNVVYLGGVGPYKIERLNVTTGKSTELFEGHTFDAVTWDPKRNQAFGVGRNLSISGRLALVQLDLQKETVRELAKLDEFYGKLSVSATGKHVGYFENGDTIVSVDVDQPRNQLRVRAGIGRFEYGRDERRVLLKRGPEEKSGDLVWVDLQNGNFRSIMHGLTFRDFHLTPDGETLIVSEPGRRFLRTFPVD